MIIKLIETVPYCIELLRLNTIDLFRPLLRIMFNSMEVINEILY